MNLGSLQYCIDSNYCGLIFSMSVTRRILNSVQYYALNSAIPEGSLQITWLDFQLNFSRCIVM
jgi:hypothetical protein